jgi:hypothetical protein
MMDAIAKRFRRFLRDSIVVRTCVFIYGAIFLAGGVALASVFFPPESMEWLAVALGVAVTGLGAFMVYTSVFGRLHRLEKAASAVSDGGEVVGVVFLLVVVVAAFPIAAIVKFLRSPWRRL